MAKRNSERVQYGFEVDGLQSAIKDITVFPRGRLLMQFLPEQALWRERPNGSLLFVQVSNNPGELKGAVIDPETWKIEPKSEFLEYIPMHRKFAAAVVLSTPNSNNTLDVIERVYQRLRDGGPIFWVESDRKLVSNKDTILSRLQQVGYVERSMIRFSENDILWRARHKATERKGVNLPEIWANSDTEWKRHYIENVKTRIRKFFDSERYIVTSFEEIMQRLENSRNIPHDLELFKSGQGIIIKSIDDNCTWRISLEDKNIPLTPICRLHSKVSRLTDMEPKPGDQITIAKGYSLDWLVRRHPNIILSKNEPIPGEKCGHGHQLYVDSRVIRKLGRGFYEVSVDVVCPHDGLIEHGVVKGLF